MQFDLAIKGLTAYYLEETDVMVLYFDTKMLNDGIVIECSSFEAETSINHPHNSPVQTMISVIYVNTVAGIDLDSCSYQIYWDNLLEWIQVRRIVKDIYDLYYDHSLTQFIEIIDRLSSSSQSSSMQTLEKSAKEILDSNKVTLERARNSQKGADQ